MKKFRLIIILLLLSNCSSNKNLSQKEIEKIIKKSDNLMSMTFKEFDIYIDKYSKKSEYPDINK